uniref:non-specific serine/threonine protein kinase n=1 Tax=Molossus molossus TaxID=27622 RepID=A0A7J8DTQ7_MOLMO|nr:hypothetical protein HJG59_009123 [Molossus molossus]
MYNQLAALYVNKEHRVGHYFLQDTMGWGSFSSVWLARQTLIGADMAIKVVKSQDFCDPFKEVHSLQLLLHTSIVTLLEVITTKDELYLIQEHVNRDLFQHLRYTDLKPENILLDRDKNVKVADFGFSAQITQETPLLSKICGTFPYMAPEMLLFEPYNEKVDVWSIGVVLSQMLTTTIPFEAQNRVEHKFNILTGRFPVPEFLSLGCQDLLKKLLTLDPDERPAFDDIMKDRWLNMGYADELSPYREPAQEGLNPQIINSMANMGFDKENIITSVTEQKYDPVMGTYLILGNDNHHCPSEPGTDDHHCPTQPESDHHYPNEPGNDYYHCPTQPVSDHHYSPTLQKNSHHHCPTQLISHNLHSPTLQKR